MQTTIAQLIALTTWGNATLNKDQALSSYDFYPGNSTCRFCEFVHFADVKNNMRDWSHNAIANSPSEWFEWLKREGVTNLRLCQGASDQAHPGIAHIPDRMLAGFIGGGGRWMIEATRPTGADYWEARWEVGDRTQPDKKIWRVTYGWIASHDCAAHDPSEGIAEIKARLAQSLTSIESFARKHQLDGFAKAFDASLSCLTSAEPTTAVYHTDIAPPNFLPPAANQLLAAVQAAWVFGGMGSWNDLGFEENDQKEYEVLSEALYRLLNIAIVVAANTSATVHRVEVSAADGRTAWWRFW